MRADLLKAARGTALASKMTMPRWLILACCVGVCASGCGVGQAEIDQSSPLDSHGAPLQPGSGTLTADCAVCTPGGPITFTGTGFRAPGTVTLTIGEAWLSFHIESNPFEVVWPEAPQAGTWTVVARQQKTSTSAESVELARIEIVVQ